MLDDIDLTTLTSTELEALEAALIVQWHVVDDKIKYLESLINPILVKRASPKRLVRDKRGGLVCRPRSSS
jgi:hypothetical protein